MQDTCTEIRTRQKLGLLWLPVVWWIGLALLGGLLYVAFKTLTGKTVDEATELFNNLAFAINILVGLFCLCMSARARRIACPSCGGTFIVSMLPFGRVRCRRCARVLC